jgi:hypothetical protein
MDRAHPQHYAYCTPHREPRRREEVTFSDEELADLNTGLAAISIHGDRLQPAVLAQTGVEAPLQ